MRNAHFRHWNIAINNEKLGKIEMHTVGPGERQENWKLLKMINTHCRTWNMARKIQKHEKWEIDTIGFGLWQKNENGGKWDTNTLWPGKRRETLKRVENEKCTL